MSYLRGYSKLLSFAMMLLATYAAAAEIRLPHLLSDHAVLQRNKPVHLWGWATPRAQLTVHFHGQIVHADVTESGAWSATLLPEIAGGPYTLTIEGDGNATVKDILVGDVWIASGQSNMEIPLRGYGPDTRIQNGDQEIAAASHPQLRLLQEPRVSADLPKQDIAGTWAVSSPDTAAAFSAVAYFFGRDLLEQEKVPIGIIEAAWGGTPADPWVSLDTLGNNAQLLPAFAERARFAETEVEGEPQLELEKREDAAAEAAGRFKPKHPWHPFEASWIPSALFNGMIAPLTPFTITGFLWYQGESNSSTDRAEHYAPLFAALIADWRMHFGQGDLPFLFAQICSTEAPGEHWGLIRDAQRRALAVANTAMAVTLDVGSATNVHPPDKQTVSARLAAAARAMVYGEAIPFQSPLPRQVTVEGSALRVWFDHAQHLDAHGKPVLGFEIAGEDHHFIPAQTRVEGSTVVVTAPAQPAPRYVRYLWANFPPSPLYNDAGLPASTFSTEWFPRLAQ